MSSYYHNYGYFVLLLYINNISSTHPLNKISTARAQIKYDTDMDKIKEFIKSYDLFGAPASLRIDKQAFLSSPQIGVVSLLLSAYFIYAFVSQLLKVVNYEQVTIKDQTLIIPDNEAIGTVKMFAIGLPGFQQNISTMFTFTAIQYENGTANPTRTQILVPCTADLWSGLIQNYTSIFTEYGMSTMYCPNITKDNPFNLKQTLRSKTPTYMSISFKFCDPNKTIGCNTSLSNNFIDKQTPFKIQLYLLDYRFDLAEEVFVNSYINTESKTLVGTGISGFTDIELSTVQIKSDISLLPGDFSSLRDQVQIQSIRNYHRQFYLASEAVLARISIYMSEKQIYYQRKLGKIDQVISYAGGLFAILTAFVGFCVGNFNKYRYEIKVGERAFDADQGSRKIKETDFGIWYYIKYSVYTWIYGLTGIRPRWTSCLQLDYLRQEVNSHMNVNRLFRKLQYIETAIGFLIDKNQQACISLLQPPSLDMVKQRRLILEYYDNIVQGEYSENLEMVMDLKDAGNDQNEDHQDEIVLKKIVSQFDQPMIKMEVQLQEIDKNTKQNKNGQITDYNAAISPQISPSPSLNNSIKKSLSLSSQNGLLFGSSQIQSPQPQPKPQHKSQLLPQNRFSSPGQPKSSLPSTPNKIFSSQSLLMQAHNIPLLPMHTQNRIIEHNAKINLTPEQQKIQYDLAICYYRLKPPIRKILQTKIPLIILCRLENKLEEMRKNNDPVLQEQNPKDEGNMKENGQNLEGSGKANNNFTNLFNFLKK